MPRFQGKPIVVEAYEFRGSPHDLPIDVAAFLTQEYVGERAQLPSTVVGGHLDETAKYSTHDIVNVGDWIVRGVSGYYRMGPGEFEAAFVALDDEGADDANARWRATYIGGDDGSTPAVLHWLGYRFSLGQPIGISSAEDAARVGRNAHFVVLDTADIEPAPRKTLHLPGKAKNPE